MLPSALALVAVAGVLLLLIGIFGDTGSNSVAAPEVTTGPATAPSVTATPPPSSSVPASTTPVQSTPAASTAPPLPTAFPDIVTVVLNATSEPGLAGRVSAYLGDLGWAVGPVGNFEVPVETSTVYYPDGYEDAARSLAAATPGSLTAVAPAGEGVATEGLTLVLGADAVDWLPAEEQGATGEPESTDEPAESPT